MTTVLSEIQIEGYIERLTIFNDSFYVISILTNNEEKKTIVGKTDVKIEENGYYEFTVVEKNHPKYKRSLYIVNVIEKQPTDKNNIIKILQNNISGVGKKTAEIIYNYFGENALKILLKEPGQIRNTNLKDKIKEKVYQHFFEMCSLNEQMIKLQEYGLTYNESYEFILNMKEKKLNPINEISQNPYIVKDTLKRVGFLKCDIIAKRIGFPKNHPIRIEQCIYHLLREAQQSGDVCLEVEQLKRKLQIYLGLPIIEIESAIQDIEMSQNVHYTYYDNDFVYLTTTDIKEQIIADKLFELNEQQSKNVFQNIDRDIDELEKIEKIKNSKFKGLHIKQREAIKTFFINNLSILSGGPGTGKTTILKFIINLCKLYGLTFLLCAPTGMASKKMTFSTNHNAKTIHKTLECDMSTGKLEFLRNDKNPLEADVIIIDECSMIDMFIFYNLIVSIKNNSKVLFIGDPDQLPSVGPGKILDDLIQSNIFPHVHLSKIYRQGKNSLIIENAHRINNQEPILLHHNNEFIEDFYFIQINNSKQVANYIKELMEFKLKNSRGYDPINDVQILLPRKKGDLGVLDYNLVLQKVLNPPSPEKEELQYKNKWSFRIGDKVINLSNNDDKDVSNGDIGFVIKIEKNSLYIDFTSSSTEEKIVKYEYEELEDLLLAYSCTVHKSQGSEYKVVIIPIIEEDYMMLYKKLVYTAITRGKELVILVGDINVLKNNLYVRSEIPRNSNLQKRLLKLKHQQIKVA